MKIAVYTIAKNEEQFVDSWANSTKEADYRLILDTGSTDRTVDRARSLGIDVYVSSINPWRFDDARNASLALIPDDIDICVALDMDEVLVPGWRKEIEKVRSETTRPRYKYVWSWKEDGSEGLTYGGDKIHRRHGYRWKYPVHEVLVADRIEEIQEWTSVEIHHHPDNSKSRGQYFPLLELAVKEDPFNDRNQYYLAREYFFNSMFDRAAEMFKKHIENPRSVWPPERAASLRYLAKCEPHLAEEWLLKALAESPGRRESLVALSQTYYEQSRWEECLEKAKMALAIEEKPLDYLCEEFAWGSLPYDLAAISSYNLGHYKEALDYGIVAEQKDPDNQRLTNNVSYYLQALES